MAAALANAVVYWGRVEDGASAFLRWRPWIGQLLEGENVFALHAYPNPPIMALLLAPFALLPAELGAMLWFALKVGLTLVGVRLVLELAAGRGPALSDGAVGLVLLLGARPVFEDLQHGNVNLWIFFLIAAGLTAWTRRHDAVAGLALALATACKLTPALLLAWFAWKREWRLLAWSALGLALFLGVVPALALGPGFSLECHVAWFDGMVRPWLFHGVVESAKQMNQSLPAVFTRLFTDVPGLRIGSVERAVNVASLSPDTVRLLLRGLVVAVVGWVAFLCRTPTTDRRDRRLAWELGLVLAAMLLISERSWKHHYVVLLLPFASLVAECARPDASPRVARAIGAALLASFLLMASTSPDLVGWLHYEGGRRAAHKHAEAWGLYAGSAVVVFAALSALLLRYPNARGKPQACRAGRAAAPPDNRQD